MAFVTVKILGQKEFEKKQIKLIRELSDKHLDKISLETEKRLQFHVLASIQRPESTGNLAKSMFREKILGGWGIGKISFLNVKAPQWRWLNYGVAGTGRRIPPGTSENPRIRGSFTPGQTPPNQGSFRGGRFVKGGGYSMNPTKPIQPHLYIQRTVQGIPNIINSVLSRIKL